MLKTAALVMSGNVVQGAILFARNIVVARMVSVEDYGIAATFAIVMAAIELATQLGLHQLIVQDSDGDDPAFQAEMQGFQLLRSFITASFCFLAAPLLAQFIGDEALTWAFRWLSLAILARGFVHFDLFRLQRRMNFVPMAIMQTIGPLTGLIVVFPLVYMFGDYRVMLFSLVAQEILTVAITHLVAERRYSLRLRLKTMRRTVIFGWPLMLNGLLLFFIMHGERVVVLRAYDLETLALFSMGVTVTMTPGQMFVKTFDSLFLPKLSAMQSSPLRFRELNYTAIEVSLVMGLVFAGITQLVTVPVILFIVGEKYSGMQWLMPWITIATAIRLFRASASIIMLSQARTGSILIANICRIAVLPISWYAAQNGADIHTVLFLAILGELLAQMTAFALMIRNVGTPLGPVTVPILSAGLCAALLGFHEYSIHIAEHSFVDPIWTKLAVAAAGAFTLGSTRRFWLMLRPEAGVIRS